MSDQHNLSTDHCKPPESLVSYTKSNNTPLSSKFEQRKKFALGNKIIIVYSFPTILLSKKSVV